MITQWDNLSANQALILRGYGGEPGIYIRASVLRAFKGDGSAAIYLTQLIYWSQSEYAAKNDGWFYLTTQKVTEELGMSRFIQERVRRVLQDAGVLEITKRGLPSKNYYRLHLDKIILCLGGEELAAQPEGNPPSVGGDASDIVGGKPSTSKYRVKIESKNTLSLPTARASQKFNVLGAGVDTAVSFITATYPLNGQGLAATEYQARRIVEKLGSVSANPTAEEAQAATDRLQEFKTALVNIRRTVDEGSLEAKWIPAFANFAGLGVQYGNEPKYKAWALKKFPEKKSEYVGL